jgi:hypothetical protein
MPAPHAELKGRYDAHTRDRAIMVSRHLRARGIVDPLVLAAMGKVPREAFVIDESTLLDEGSQNSEHRLEIFEPPEMALQ